MKVISWDVTWKNTSALGLSVSWDSVGGGNYQLLHMNAE